MIHVTTRCFASMHQEFVRVIDTEQAESAHARSVNVLWLGARRGLR
jgi:hypothetical protein